MIGLERSNTFEYRMAIQAECSTSARSLSKPLAKLHTVIELRLSPAGD